MTFLSNANLPQSGGQVRPEAPEDLLRAMVQRLVQETIQTEFDQSSGRGRTSAAASGADGATAISRGPSRREWGSWSCGCRRTAHFLSLGTPSFTHRPLTDVPG
jgi:hypothetical protein